MPIHSTAYRPWDGVKVPEWSRSVTICSTGVMRASRSRWLKRLLFAAFIPLIFFAVPLFLYEQSSRDPLTWQSASRMIQNMVRNSAIQDAIAELPRRPSAEQFDAIRHQVWAFFMLSMLRYPQALLMIVVVGIVAPPLISQDLRTRAYLIYFSRPITRLEYIVGKVGVIATFLGAITIIPTMILYLAGLLMSPSFSVLLATWDLPFRILLGAACLIIPMSLVSLAFSSLTLESRYAAFAWFAMWIIGHVSYLALSAMPSFQAQQNGVSYEPGWRILASPYQVIAVVQSYIFQFDNHPQMVLPAFLMLLAISTLSLIVLFRRVNAPMRA